VQRAAKFVKYLPDFGWSPTVLTVSNPSVPVFDRTLLGEIPNSVCIVEAKTLEPSYEAKQSVSASDQTGSKQGVGKLLKTIIRGFANILLQPDPQILWLPAARRAAKKLLKEKKFDVIVATAPPFSSLILGAMLSKMFCIPLVLDYRDEWDISNAVWENKSLGRLSSFIQSRLQNYALKRASLVIATTQLSVTALEEKIALCDSKAAAICIYNGFDDSDINLTNRIQDPHESGSYVLSYVGTLWNLTSIAPVVKALHKLQREHPTVSDFLQLITAGRITAAQEQILDQLKDSAVSVTRRGYVEHSEAIDIILNSDGLLLLLSDMQVAGRVVPAKIFEYMATGNSIFVVAPKGEVWDLLSSYPRSYCIEPSDIDKLMESIVKDFQRVAGEGHSRLEGFNVYPYTRKKLSGDLAEALNGLVHS